MTTGLSLAFFKGSSPPTGHRSLSQSQPNPLQLTSITSAIYPGNQPVQTHCVYLLSFQEFNPGKRPFFSEKAMDNAAPALPSRGEQYSGRLSIEAKHAKNMYIPKAGMSHGISEIKTALGPKAGMSFRISEPRQKT